MKIYVRKRCSDTEKGFKIELFKIIPNSSLFIIKIIQSLDRSYKLSHEEDLPSYVETELPIFRVGLVRNLKIFSFSVKT